MKYTKKFISLAIVFVMVLAMSITALAYNVGSNSKETEGYGLLKGTLSETGYYTTSVEKNPDHAYLTIAGEIQNRLGETIGNVDQIKSEDGATDFAGAWNYIPAGAYVLYGAHGVQGGSKYGAAVVYTVVHVNTSSN